MSGFRRTPNGARVEDIHFQNQMSNEKKPGCLGFLGDYTTQLCGDYNNPL